MKQFWISLLFIALSLGLYWCYVSYHRSRKLNEELQVEVELYQKKLEDQIKYHKQQLEEIKVDYECWKARPYIYSIVARQGGGYSCIVTLHTPDKFSLSGEECVMGKTLEEVRNKLPRGLKKLQTPKNGATLESWK